MADADFVRHMSVFGDRKMPGRKKHHIRISKHAEIITETWQGLIFLRIGMSDYGIMAKN